MTEQPERITWTQEEHDAMFDRWVGQAVLFHDRDGVIRRALVMGVSEPPAWGAEPMLDLVAVLVRDYEEPGLDFYSHVPARKDQNTIGRQRPELVAELNARQSWMPIPWTSSE